jgi:hypothetical protein
MEGWGGADVIADTDVGESCVCERECSRPGRGAMQTFMSTMMNVQVLVMSYRTGWSTRNALEMCFGGAMFESRLGHRLY